MGGQPAPEGSGDGPVPAGGSGDEVLDLVTRLAELLVAGGYEGTLGSERRLRAVAAAYGARAEVSVGAESAVVGVGGRSRVVARPPEVPQLDRVSALKPWLREVTAGRLPVAEARRRLEAIAASPAPYRGWARVAGTVLFSVGFGMSIQPTWQQVWITGVLGVVVGLVLEAVRARGASGRVAPLLCSVLVGALVLGVERAGWVSGGTIQLMVPVLFLFIPGDAITMAVLEVAAGRLTAGAARLAQSAVALVTLAFGPVLAAAALGSDQGEIFDVPVAPDFGPVAGWLGWTVFAVGVQWVFGMRRGDLPWALLLVLGTYGVQLLAVRGFGTLAGTFLAAAVMAFTAVGLGARQRTPPAYVLYLGAFFVLTPGSHGLRGLEAWVGGHPVQGLHDIAGMVALMVAIALGMLVGVTLRRGPAPAGESA
ncbi:threonine/serine ThrE exporter family protein [Streptomyces sp. NPDC002454]